MANSLTQTTLSAAITVNQNQFAVASTTNIFPPSNNKMQQIYVIDPGSTRGELMTVTGVPSAGVVQVSRLDEFKGGHLSGAIVIINPQDVSLGDGFVGRSPVPVPAKVPVFQWIVDVTNGEQWLYSTVTNSWVPGFNNISAPISPTALVTATAAVLPAPTGPLMHVAASGTPAVTGITKPNGFTSGQLVMIPDAAFTWTTGDGSIAVAGTAVANKTITWTYDAAVSKFFPSYT